MARTDLYKAEENAYTGHPAGFLSTAVHLQ